jgi:hypothetical protein
VARRGATRRGPRRATILLGAGVALAAVGLQPPVLRPPAPFDVLGSGTGAAGAAVGVPRLAHPSAGPADRFAISGAATGLYPGGSAPLVLSVSNPNPFAIEVTSLTVSVGNAGAGCPAANLAVTPFTGTLAVAGRATAAVTLFATMSHGAPDACQGAVFSLRYAATAVRS